MAWRESLQEIMTPLATRGKTRTELMADRTGQLAKMAQQESDMGQIEGRAELEKLKRARDTGLLKDDMSFKGS